MPIKKKTASSPSKKTAAKKISAVSKAPPKTRRQSKPVKSLGRDIFRTVYDHSPIGIEIFDRDGYLIDVNGAGLANFGVSDVKELKGFNFFNDPMFPKKMKDKLMKGNSVRYEAIFDFDEARRLGLFNTDRTGTISLDMMFSPIRMEKGGETIGYLAQVQDITERKKSEEALRASEERYRTLFETANDAIFLHGMTEDGLPGKFVAVNDFACRVYGYSKEEFARMSPADINDPERASDPRQITEKLLREKHLTFETVDMTKSGRSIQVEISSSLFESDGKPMILSAVRDITERKMGEAEKDLLLKAISVTNEGIAITDSMDRFIYVNDAHAGIYGRSRDELTGRTWRDMVTPDLVPLIEPALSRTLRNRAVGFWSGECPAIKKDGTAVPTEITATALWDNKGNYLGHVCVVRDITERKQADAALRERERQLSESQRIAHIGSWEHNLTTGKAVWSDELFRLLGLDPGKDKADFDMFFGMIHPEDQPVLKSAVEETVRTGKHFSIEYRFIPRDGKTKIIHAQAELMRDKTGTQMILSGTGQDVTERKKIEEMLLKSRDNLARAQEMGHMGSWEWDVVTNEVAWTDEVFRIYGLSPENNSPGYDVVINTVCPEYRGRFIRDVEDALADRRPLQGEYCIVRPDGTRRNTYTKGEVLFDERGRPLKMFGMVQDITERVETERRLRESEDRFRTIFEQATDGILIADLEDNRQIEANQAACSMLGYSRDELLSLYVGDLHPEEDLPGIIDIFERQARGEISLASDIPMLRKDGTVIYVDVNATRITLNGRQCLIGIFRDITERKQADAALRERERQLSESQRIAHIGSWEHNLTTGKAVWSDELFRLLDLDPQEDQADFDMFFGMIHPEDQPVLKSAIEETVRTGKHFSIEYRFITRDGKTKIIHAQAELMRDKTGTQMILSGTGQDVTGRREAEDRIREALREKEVLLKEIHHRVKNNMAVVSALLELQARHSRNSDVRKILEDSQNRINSMSLVHEKLYESENLSSINVRDYLNELVQHLLDGYTTKKVRFVHEVDDMELDIDHIIPLGLILTELLTNSIKHAFDEVGSPVIEISMHADGGLAGLTYRDNGPGLPEGLGLEDAPTLGLKLIYMLSYQLKGTVALDGPDRAGYTLSFPI